MCDLVTIIIPAYNAQEYIRATLGSVLAQLYTELEVIVVDDGSTDRTAEIVADMAKSDRRVRLLTCANAGVSEARNMAMDEARGRWLMFVDSDDLLHPRGVEVLLRGAEQSGADIVLGKMTHRWPFPEMPESPGMVVRTPEKAIERTLYRRGGISGPWGKLYRTEKIRDVKFLRGLRYEDLEIFPRFYERANAIATVDAVLYYYRPTQGSFMNTFSAVRFDVLKVTCILEEHMASRHPALAQAAADRRLSAAFNMLALTSELPSDMYPRQVAECWDIVRKYRRRAIFNPHNRLRNKLAALLSYMGLGAFQRVGRCMRKILVK